MGGAHWIAVRTLDLGGHTLTADRLLLVGPGGGATNGALDTDELWVRGSAGVAVSHLTVGSTDIALSAEVNITSLTLSGDGNVTFPRLRFRGGAVVNEENATLEVTDVLITEGALSLLRLSVLGGATLEGDLAITDRDGLRMGETTTLTLRNRTRLTLPAGSVVAGGIGVQYTGTILVSGTGDPVSLSRLTGDSVTLAGPLLVRDVLSLFGLVTLQADLTIADPVVGTVADLRVEANVSVLGRLAVSNGLSLLAGTRAVFEYLTIRKNISIPAGGTRNAELLVQYLTLSADLDVTGGTTPRLELYVRSSVSSLSPGSTLTIYPSAQIIFSTGATVTASVNIVGSRTAPGWVFGIFPAPCLPTPDPPVSTPSPPKCCLDYWPGDAIGEWVTFGDETSNPTLTIQSGYHVTGGLIVLGGRIELLGPATFDNLYISPPNSVVFDYPVRVNGALNCEGGLTILDDLTVNNCSFVDVLQVYNDGGDGGPSKIAVNGVIALGSGLVLYRAVQFEELRIGDCDAGVTVQYPLFTWDITNSSECNPTWAEGPGLWDIVITARLVLNARFTGWNLGPGQREQPGGPPRYEGIALLSLNATATIISGPLGRLEIAGALRLNDVHQNITTLQIEGYVIPNTDDSRVNGDRTELEVTKLVLRGVPEFVGKLYVRNSVSPYEELVGSEVVPGKLTVVAGRELHLRDGASVTSHLTVDDAGRLFIESWYIEPEQCPDDPGLEYGPPVGRDGPCISPDVWRNPAIAWATFGSGVVESPRFLTLAGGTNVSGGGLNVSAGGLIELLGPVTFSHLNIEAGVDIKFDHQVQVQGWLNCSGTLTIMDNLNISGGHSGYVDVLNVYNDPGGGGPSTIAVNGVIGLGSGLILASNVTFDTLHIGGCGPLLPEVHVTYFEYDAPLDCGRSVPLSWPFQIEINTELVLDGRFTGTSKALTGVEYGIYLLILGDSAKITSTFERSTGVLEIGGELRLNSEPQYVTTLKIRGQITQSGVATDAILDVRNLELAGEVELKVEMRVEKSIDDSAGVQDPIILHVLEGKTLHLHDRSVVRSNLKITDSSKLNISYWDIGLSDCPGDSFPYGPPIERDGPYISPDVWRNPPIAFATFGGVDGSQRYLTLTGGTEVTGGGLNVSKDGLIELLGPVTFNHLNILLEAAVTFDYQVEVKGWLNCSGTLTIMADLNVTGGAFVEKLRVHETSSCEPDSFRVIGRIGLGSELFLFRNVEFGSLVVVGASPSAPTSTLTVIYDYALGEKSEPFGPHEIIVNSELVLDGGLTGIGEGGSPPDGLDRLTLRRGATITSAQPGQRGALTVFGRLRLNNLSHYVTKLNIQGVIEYDPELSGGPAFVAGPFVVGSLNLKGTTTSSVGLVVESARTESPGPTGYWLVAGELSFVAGPVRVNLDVQNLTALTRDGTCSYLGLTFTEGAILSLWADATVAAAVTIGSDGALQLGGAAEFDSLVLETATKFNAPVTVNTVLDTSGVTLIIEDDLKCGEGSQIGTLVVKGRLAADAVPLALSVFSAPGLRIGALELYSSVIFDYLDVPADSKLLCEFGHTYQYDTDEAECLAELVNRQASLVTISNTLTISGTLVVTALTIAGKLEGDGTLAIGSELVLVSGQHTIGTLHAGGKITGEGGLTVTTLEIVADLSVESQLAVGNVTVEDAVKLSIDGQGKLIVEAAEGQLAIPRLAAVSDASVDGFDRLVVGDLEFATRPSQLVIWGLNLTGRNVVADDGFLTVIGNLFVEKDTQVPSVVLEHGVGVQEGTGPATLEVTSSLTLRGDANISNLKLGTDVDAVESVGTLKVADSLTILGESVTFKRLDLSKGPKLKGLAATAIVIESLGLLTVPRAPPPPDPPADASALGPVPVLPPPSERLVIGRLTLNSSSAVRGRLFISSDLVLPESDGPVIEELVLVGYADIVNTGHVNISGGVCRIERLTADLLSTSYTRAFEISGAQIEVGEFRLWKPRWFVHRNDTFIVGGGGSLSIEKFFVNFVPTIPDGATTKWLVFEVSPAGGPGFVLGEGKQIQVFGFREKAVDVPVEGVPNAEQIVYRFRSHVNDVFLNAVGGGCHPGITLDIPAPLGGSQSAISIVYSPDFSGKETGINFVSVDKDYAWYNVTSVSGQVPAGVQVGRTLSCDDGSGSAAKSAMTDGEIAGVTVAVILAAALISLVVIYFVFLRKGKSDTDATP